MEFFHRDGQDDFVELAKNVLQGLHLYFFYLEGDGLVGQVIDDQPLLPVGAADCLFTYSLEVVDLQGNAVVG